jgi:cation-transporting ATPase 13A2
MGGNQHVLPVQKMTLPEPRPIGSVFPSSSRSPTRSRQISGTLTPASGHAQRPLDTVNSPLLGGKETITELRYVEYRYYRFVLHPQTGRFIMARYGLKSILLFLPY